MPRTFDELSISDLESVYEQGKEEVLRDHAFRILLLRNDSVEKLERLAFKGDRGPVDWTISLTFTSRWKMRCVPWAGKDGSSVTRESRLIIMNEYDLL